MHHRQRQQTSRSRVDGSKNAVQTVLDIPSLVEGGNDNGEAGLGSAALTEQALS